jgi:hypothetical protein
MTTATKTVKNIDIKLPEQYEVQERNDEVLVKCSINDSNYLNKIVRLLMRSRARGNVCYWKKRIETLKFMNELEQKHIDKYEKFLEDHKRWDTDEAKPLIPLNKYDENVVEYRFSIKEYRDLLQGHLSQMIHNKCHNKYMEKKKIVQSKIKAQIIDEMLKECN